MLNTDIDRIYHGIGGQGMKKKKKDVDNWLYYIEILNNKNNKKK